MSGPVEAAVLEALGREVGPSFGVRHVDSRGGTLRVIEAGQGPPLVAIHGRGSSAVTWAAVLPALARTRRVLAVDLPGFGSSRGFRFERGGAEEALAFFVDPVEAWIEAEGLLAPAILGHSLGAFVAIELALRRRIAPSALVLIAPGGVGPEASFAARAFFRLGPERLAGVLGPDRFGRLIGADSPPAAALTHEIHAVPGGRPDACRAFDLLVPLFGPAPNRRDRLGSIATPALVIGGDQDAALPSPLAIAASAALGQGELDIVDAGHSPHTEAPERVLARVEAFLARAG